VQGGASEEPCDEIMDTLVANIRMSLWYPSFIIRGRHGGVAVWKMNLN
jgi:hypothetical protein